MYSSSFLFSNQEKFYFVVSWLISAIHFVSSHPPYESVCVYIQKREQQIINDMFGTIADLFILVVCVRYSLFVENNKFF
jgi:hypothetical protein